MAKGDRRRSVPFMKDQNQIEMAKTTLTNAKLMYSGGRWKLSFPCNGSGPRLFLEWIINYQYEHRFDKYPLTYNIDKSVSDDSEIDSDVFIVRFEFIMREDAKHCCNYINSNS